MTTTDVIAGLMVVNFVAFLSFAWDKQAAIAGRRRVPERRLLLLALVGGSLGALLGQQLLRHKTRKQPFRGVLIGIVVLQLLAIAAAVLLLLWR